MSFKKENNPINPKMDTKIKIIEIPNFENNKFIEFIFIPPKDR
jgi:hypothetical protein